MYWHTPKLFNGLKHECGLKITEEQGVRARSLAQNTLGVEGRARAMGWDQEEWQASTIHTDLHKTKHSMVSA